MRVTIVLPTYNESSTLPLLLPRLGEAVSRARLKGEVIVVDDASPDGTAEIASRLGAQLRETLPVTVIVRPGKAGLASAVLEGVRRSRGDVVVVMDGDLSHPPEIVPRLIEAMAGGADIAVGSRYTAGGGIERWPVWRRALSLGATHLARLLLRVPVCDPMSGFFAARREVFERTHLEETGYKILLEILVRQRGIRVREVPYRFSDRAGGRSKLDAAEVLRGVRLLGRLWLARAARGRPRVIE